MGIHPILLALARKRKPACFRHGKLSFHSLHLVINIKMSHIRMSKIGMRSIDAFTLIEMVIVIAIVGIITLILIVSLGGGRIQREVETNAREFASVLKEAQNYALTGKQVGSGITCRFDVVWAGSSYHLDAVAKSGSTCTGTPAPIATYTLKQGVSFQSPGSASFVLPWASTTAKMVRFTKSSLAYTVCLDSNGSIIDYAGSNDCP